MGSGFRDSQPLPHLGEVGNVIDQLREDLRCVAARLGWARERVLAVGSAVRRAIEAGDQETIKSFAREFAWRRQPTHEAGHPISLREAMPMTAALVDEYRAVFGDVKVTFAMEAGLVVGWRTLSANEVSGDHLVLRKPDEEAALMKRLKRR